MRKPTNTKGVQSAWRLQACADGVLKIHFFQIAHHLIKGLLDLGKNDVFKRTCTTFSQTVFFQQTVQIA